MELSDSSPHLLFYMNLKNNIYYDVWESTINNFEELLYVDIHELSYDIPRAMVYNNLRLDVKTIVKSIKSNIEIAIFLDFCQEF